MGEHFIPKTLFQFQKCIGREINILEGTKMCVSMRKLTFNRFIQVE